MPNISEAAPNRNLSQTERAASIENHTALEARRLGVSAKENRGTANEVQNASQSVLTFIQEHPVVAAGGALAAGAAIAMLVHSRRTQANRLDRRLIRNVRQMERNISREARALRNSDFADRASRLTNSLGDALSRVDFQALSERGQAYLDALRNRTLR